MNEFHVVYDKAKRETIFIDESLKGRMLLQDHDVVVMRSVARYCLYTDGILGNDIEVMGTFESAKDAQEFIDYRPDCGDEVCYYTRRRTEARGTEKL